ncbi:MAG: tRNA threonylcarbamoyladenosine dehydratase [Firmicutes bacterium]|nr:tRNA threonylcarbamoyladenosine dehydratase [Bacillota bacterium]
MNPFARTELLLTPQGVEKLKHSAVAVFGVGGVGGFAAEALARSGVGRLDLFDHDTVSLSNLNRQIIATLETVGRPKVDVMKERIASINPEAEVHANRCFYLPENAGSIDLSQYDYIVDAVDTVAAKLELAERATRLGVPVISCMGAGNKLDPTRFEVADLSKTSVCPLARVMRIELRRRGITHLKVVYSKEEPRVPLQADQDDAPGRRSVPGSVAFVPSAAGLIAAGAVVRDLCAEFLADGKN